MIKPTSRPEVNKIAEKANSDIGVFPTHRTLRHFTQTKTEVVKVIAIATVSISYIVAPYQTAWQVYIGSWLRFD